MKKLLIALISIPGIVNAQIELGINGGIAPFKMSSGDYYTPTNTTNNTGAYFDATAAVSLTRFLRVGIDYGTGAFSFTHSYTSQQTTYQAGKPISCYSVFLDLLSKYKKSTFHGGVATGYAAINNNNMEGKTLNGNGTLIGVHGGYSYDVYKDLSLFAQISIDYIKMNVKTANYTLPDLNNKLVYVPLQLGIHYKIAFRKPKKDKKDKKEETEIKPGNMTY